MIPSDMENLMYEKSKELYKLCDVENKGFISRRDLLRLSNHGFLNPEQLEDVFVSLDKDKNGYLSLQEFTEGFSHFLGLASFGNRTSPEIKVFQPHRTRQTSESGNEEDDFEENQFNQILEQIGVSETIEEVDSIKELWAKLRRDNPELLPILEGVLYKFCSEIQKKQSEFKNLEIALKTKSTAHDEDVRKLYEEMEHQIKQEKEKLLAEERMKERLLREELETEIREKDKQYQKILRKHEETRLKLEDLKTVHAETAEEKENLQKQKDILEQRLDDTEQNLTECQEYIDELNRKSREEKKKRAKATLEMTEGIALERENLVKELEMLRDVNKKLKDEREEKLLLSQLKGENMACITDVMHVIDGKVDSPTGSCHCGAMSTTNSDVGTIEGDRLDQIVPDINNMDPANRSRSQRGSVLSSYFKMESYEVDDVYEDGVHCDFNSKDNLRTGIASDTNAMRSGALLNLTTGSPQRIYKIVFIGDSGVGKSSLIHRFCNETFKESFCATIGVDFQVKTIPLEHQLVALQLWDTAGQERFRSITRQYYRKADGLVVVYDATSYGSFTNVREWIDSIEEEITQQGKLTLMILANKVDAQVVVRKSDGEKLAEDYGAIFYEVSAKTNHNVTEAFYEMAGKLKTREDDEISHAFKISEESVTNKKSCCKK